MEAGKLMIFGATGYTGALIGNTDARKKEPNGDT